MNAFFAGIEQLDDPDLRGKPVAVTNGLRGTCCITCSYEARAAGVKTGMHLREARKLCPGLVRKPARPERYTEISSRIMQGFQDYTDQIEIFSVDEAFLDVTGSQRLFGGPVALARQVKEMVYAISGVKCSVGLSSGKLLAKWAAKQNKPDGFTVLPPGQERATLRDVPVTEICGISKGIAAHLAAHGAETCGQVAALPITVLAGRWGNIGRRLWQVCGGYDPAPLELTVPPPQTIGHGKVMPPDTTHVEIIETFMRHMAEKVAARLRRHGYVASLYSIGLRTIMGWVGGKYKTLPGADGAVIMTLGRRMMAECWHGEGVFQIQINALDPVPTAAQGDWLRPEKGRRDALHGVVDRINARYGEFTLSPAPLLDRSDMPNVISPAWKPFGHRETIQSGGYDLATDPHAAADDTSTDALMPVG
ncbi:MAG: DNA polymerase IV [Wenzhouxiangellaceae bacterium]